MNLMISEKAAGRELPETPESSQLAPRTPQLNPVELPCQCGILNSMPPVRLAVHATERDGLGRRRSSCSSHDFGLEGGRSTWPRHCRIEK